MLPESMGLLEKQLEAILFVATLPASEEELAMVLGISKQAVRSSILKIQEHYKAQHGLCLLQQAGGWQMASSPDLADTVSHFRNTAQEQRVRLSKAALETLSVVAYNQPVTRSEVEEIRTVRSDRVIETLMKHGLVRIAGRKKSIGMPLLYRTTDRFLDLFGLESISALPRLEDLQDLVVSDDISWGSAADADNDEE